MFTDKKLEDFKEQNLEWVKWLNTIRNIENIEGIGIERELKEFPTIKNDDFINARWTKCDFSDPGFPESFLMIGNSMVVLDDEGKGRSKKVPR